MSDNVELRPFEPDHFQCLNLRQDPGQEALTGSPEKFAALERVAKFPSWTLFCGERPVACAGVVILWPGVAEAWAFVAKDIMAHKVSFVRSVKKKLKEIEISHKLHRIQAVVHEAHETGHAFMELLGFYPEAKLLAYGPDKTNFILYSRLRWH